MSPILVYEPASRRRRQAAADVRSFAELNGPAVAIGEICTLHANWTVEIAGFPGKRGAVMGQKIKKFEQIMPSHAEPWD